MTRTDIHSPSYLVPEEYRTVFIGSNQDAFGSHVPAPAELVSNFAPQLGRLGNWQCHHCGASIRYYAILEHLPSGLNIVVGETCLHQFNLTSTEFANMRKAHSAARAERRIVNERKTFLTYFPDLEFLMDLDAEWLGNPFISDIARKLRAYGNLSVWQVEAVRMVVARKAEYG